MRKLLLAILGTVFLIAFKDDVYPETSYFDPDLFKIKPPEDIGYLEHPVDIMDRSTHEAYNFDSYKDKSATISYTVTKEEWIRLRIVRRDNKSLLLRTIQDFTHNMYGKTYEVKWDGKDSSGNIVDNKKIFVLFEAKDQGNLKIHQKHSKDSCKDPRLRISRPKMEDTVNGKLEIVAAFSESLVGLNGGGYEGRLYVDYNLFYKVKFNKSQEGGFNFIIDTTRIKNGVHIFTINLDDYHDHIGTASVILEIQN